MSHMWHQQQPQPKQASLDSLGQCQLDINISQVLGSMGLGANVKTTLDASDTQTLLQPLHFTYVDNRSHGGDSVRLSITFLLLKQPRYHRVEN